MPPPSVSPEPPSGNARPSTSWRGKVLLFLASLAVALVAVEAGYRLVEGIPLFSTKNWRMERLSAHRLGERAIFDPLLGWVLKPNFKHEAHTTLDHGIRLNNDEKSIRTGGILAVGDSFTEGWEVDDDESWPAFLEGMINIPVVNGGVGGFATDQIILRAEQLLPIVKPKTLIVGFLDYDIFRAGHSHFGAPKPHFTLEGGTLRYHPPPPVDPQVRSGFASGIGRSLRAALGYSAVMDFVVGRLAPNYWYASDDTVYLRKVNIDPVSVTCALLARLKKKTEAEGVRMLLFMQHRAEKVLEADVAWEDARKVMACAQAEKIEVVDQFDQLRVLAKANADSMSEYYFQYEDGSFGHMTPDGNWLAAELLAKSFKP